VSIAAIDASALDRVAVSRQYTTHPNYRFQSLKTTLLVDCSTGAILNEHCTTTKPHDTKDRLAGPPSELRVDALTKDYVDHAATREDSMFLYQHYGDSHQPDCRLRFYITIPG
jgi:hypothetical protein